MPYEIHKVINDTVMRLADSAYPNEWITLYAPLDAKTFATAGGARNHIKNHGLHRAKPVKVKRND